jgi:hypothetical protein
MVLPGRAAGNGLMQISLANGSTVPTVKASTCLALDW